MYANLLLESNWININNVQLKIYFISFYSKFQISLKYNQTKILFKNIKFNIYKAELYITIMVMNLNILKAPNYIYIHWNGEIW